MRKIIIVLVALYATGCATTGQTPTEEISGAGACAAPHDHHEHAHQAKCGHQTVTHNDHKDYLHDGHTHCPHAGHYDEMPQAPKP